MTSLADNPETYKQCDLELSNWGDWSRAPLVKLGYLPGPIFKHIGKQVSGRDTNENMAMYTDGVIARLAVPQRAVLKGWYIAGMDYIRIMAYLKITRPTAERRLLMAQQVYWDMTRKKVA